MKTYDCVIIGAGPAGIGVALKLQELGIKFIILEQNTIGSSFKKWNRETRFITPSFTGNAFGQVDLNSIHYDSSPGFFHMTEHLSGKQYAEYLEAIVMHSQIKVAEGEKVACIKKNNDIFTISTDTNTYTSTFVISAVGEFHFPSSGSIKGYKNTVHYSQLSDYEGYNDSQSPIPVVGGYESSIDAAYNLYKKGKEVHIFSSKKINEKFSSDPSKILSLYTSERFREMQDSPRVTIVQGVVTEISHEKNTYTLVTDSGKKFMYEHTPILGTGFVSGLSYLGNLVGSREDGLPLLNKYDELEKTPGIFIVGPQVRQEALIFCFIFKFRARFGVIALKIAKRLGKDIDEQVKHTWEKQGFFLDDLSCCGDECVC